MAYRSAYSARFRSGNSNYASLTPAAGTQDKWKIRANLKRGLLSSGTQTIISAGGASADAIYLNSSDKLCWDFGGTQRLVSTAVFRDPGCSITFEFIYDAGNATAVLRARVFFSEGGRALQEITAWDTDTRSSITTGTSKINTNVVHNIGRNSAGANNYLDGHLDDIALINNDAASGFSGRTNPISGTWDVIAPVSSKWWLTFDTPTNTTTFGNDSGSDNAPWTMNNFSVTAGVTNDALTDTPTNYGTDTGAGGEVRGNYCTLNPLDNRDAVFSNANLTATGGTGNCTVGGTFAMTAGKWIFDARIDSTSGGPPAVGVGAAATALSATSYYVGQDATSWGMFVSSTVNGKFYNNASPSAAFFTYAVGDLVVCAIDIDAGKGWFGQYTGGVLTWANNGGVGNPATGANPTFTFTAGLALKPMFRTDSGGVTANFGQRVYGYTAPTGFKALCTQNLPDPAIVKPNTYFDALLYTGSVGAAQNLTGLNFQPDFAWLKARTGIARNHAIFDSVRGANAGIYPSLTAAEGTWSGQAFLSNGFTVDRTFSTEDNANGESMIGWFAKKGALPGIDIVGQTAPASGNVTINHSLGVTPELVILKSRAGGTANWPVWVSGIGTDHLNLNTNGARNASGYMVSQSPSTFVHNIALVNASNTQIAYLFASVPGFSKIGSYVGNGSSDGPFVWCGFRPRLIMWKRADATTGDWGIIDTARSSNNVANLELYPDLSNAEATVTSHDILSNGFKLRGAIGNYLNASGGTYIFMAFAEIPQKYSATPPDNAYYPPAHPARRAYIRR